jgi:predicted nucleic acid-binding protein
MTEQIDMTEYLLDTWAWIEFYIGSEKGKEIYRKIEEEECYTSIISLAEMSDNYNSGNLKSDNKWSEIRGFVESKTKIINLTPEICRNAGKIKQEEREKFPDFGLMDAIILATFRKNDLRVITGDKHLKDKKKAEKLE